MKLQMQKSEKWIKIPEQITQSEMTGVLIENSGEIWLHFAQEKQKQNVTIVHLLCFEKFCGQK